MPFSEGNDESDTANVPYFSHLENISETRVELDA